MIAGVFIWLIFAIIVGTIGSSRSIGFFGSFLLSLILSPIIGLIITLFSKSDSQKEYEQKMLRIQESQSVELKGIKAQQIAILEQSKRIEDLERLAKLRSENILTEEEFTKAKETIISAPARTSKSLNRPAISDKLGLDLKEKQSWNNGKWTAVIAVLALIFIYVIGAVASCMN